MVGPMSDFEWDPVKDRTNRTKHGVGFEIAQHAFLDPLRVIAEDLDALTSDIGDPVIGKASLRIEPSFCVAIKRERAVGDFDHEKDINGQWPAR